jgi:YfiH family protein
LHESSIRPDAAAPNRNGSTRERAVRFDWIVPEWPAPANVKAFVTTRSGGVSDGAFSSLNLGLSSGDEPDAVRANRRIVGSVLPASPRWLRQVHGTRVVHADDSIDTPEADASIALRRGTVCAILVADCLPVLLTDRAGTLVAAAHAGWRGLAGGVLDATLAQMARAGAPAHNVLAYIGPGIGPNAFEVGDDVRDAFMRRDAGAARAFTPYANGKWLADLPLLARDALACAGVREVFGGSQCTYSDPARFFSYRRDGATGRMGACIWLD